MFARITQAAALAAMLASPALAQPQTGITLGMVLEPPTLDPTGNAAAAVDEIVYANVFEGLTRIGPDGQVLPGLAESWQAQDGGKAYLFQLRPNVTFHDGSSFDAQDVVFSLDRARAADSTNAQKALFQGIESVQPQGPLSVRVTLKAADGSFPFKMAWGDAVMVDQASIAQIATHPVGTGPFRFQNWVQGDRVNLSAYDGYWGEKPALQTATFRFIPDPTAAFAAMMAGDVDAFPIYPAPETLPPMQPLICYEAVFPQHLITGANRPQWLLQVTNDGWFGQISGPWQHLAQARLRAIESGLPLMRAANTGVSAVIDARGQIRAELDLNREGRIDARLPGALPPTPWATWRDWPALILACALVILAIFRRRLTQAKA